MNSLSRMAEYIPFLIMWIVFFGIPLSLSGMGMVVAFFAAFHRNEKEDKGLQTINIKFRDIDIELKGSIRFALVVGGIIVAIVGAYIPTIAPSSPRSASDIFSESGRFTEGGISLEALDRFNDIEDTP